MVRSALAYLALCRPDAPVIALFSYLVGAHLAGGAIGWRAVLVAGLLAGVSTNFIYSLNSVTDVTEDRISHPERPLPAGRVSRRGAATYVAVLLGLAVLYPLWVADSPEALALYWLLPVLGIVYSVAPIRLRRHPAVGVVVVSCGLVTPMALGVVENGGLGELWPLLASLLLFCLAVVPLKAVEEVLEARATGARNLFDRFGRRLFLWTALGLVIDVGFVSVASTGHGRIFVLVMCAGALACLVGFWGRHDVTALYRSVIRVVLLIGVVYFVVLQFAPSH